MKAEEKKIELVCNWKGRNMKIAPVVGKTMRVGHTTSSPPASVYEDYIITEVKDNGDVMGYMDYVYVEEHELED